MQSLQPIDDVRTERLTVRRTLARFALSDYGLPIAARQTGRRGAELNAYQERSREERFSLGFASLTFNARPSRSAPSRPSMAA